MKRIISLLLCLAMTAALSGCNSQTAAVTATLPPAQTQFEAPVSDALMDYSRTVALYLPARDGQRLIARYEQLRFSHSQHCAEAVVRALISAPANQQTRALGGNVVLSLHGSNPVTVAGGVCTVNLAASALQLEQNDFYTVCLGLAATLCSLNDIHAVNVLIADQAVGMDITATLPLGCLTAHAGESLPALWEQLIARRTPLGENPANVPTNATATLYFPLQDGSGIVAETQNISFAGQTPQLLAKGLLTALSMGAQYTSGACSMPDVNAMLIYPPAASDMEGGSRVLTLRFIGDLAARLAPYEIDTACFIASITQTLLTFVPSISAVDVSIGNDPLGTLYNAHHGTLLVDNGRIRRAAFDSYLSDSTMTYAVRNGKLASVRRTLPAVNAASPRKLLELLFAGVTQAEADEGFSAPLPAGLDGHDILGISITGDTVLINLSARCATAFQTLDPQAEQLACYAIVNTLCEAKGVRRAVFFFGGTQVQTLGGAVCWGGEFLYCPGLITETKE